MEHFRKVGEVGMSMEYVNRICPNCQNPNYMRYLGDYSKVYKYKCLNCNRYFNDIDFEKDPVAEWLAFKQGCGTGE